MTDVLLADLLADGSLALDVKVAGDPTRSVRWVHAIDLADPTPFLRGGEVVLTTGAWQRAGQDARGWMDLVAAADAVAVGFGLVQPGDQIPPGLLEGAEAHGLTLFEVPVEVPFVQIVEAFVAARRGEWEAPLRRQLAHHEAVVSALRAERGVASALRTLKRRLGLDLAVVDGTTVHGHVPEPAHRVALTGSGLVGGGSTEASMLLPRPLDELDVDVQAALTSTMPLLVLELERERALQATEQRYAREVVDWIQAGASSPDAVAGRLERLGVPVDRPLTVVVARDVPLHLLTAALTPALAVEHDGEVVLLLVDQPQRTELPGYVGIGRPAPVDNLRLGLLQARHAAETLTARGRPGWLAHEELSSPTLLLTAQDPSLLEAMAHTVLAEVLASDETRGTELLRTLRVFLDHGGRWQEAADALHVHINTLRHRLKRVEDLTGRSLGSTQDRVDLFLALRSLDHPG